MGPLSAPSPMPLYRCRVKSLCLRMLQSSARAGLSSFLTFLYWIFRDFSSFLSCVILILCRFGLTALLLALGCLVPNLSAPMLIFRVHNWSHCFTSPFDVLRQGQHPHQTGTTPSIWLLLRLTRCSAGHWIWSSLRSPSWSGGSSDLLGSCTFCHKNRLLSSSIIYC